MPAVEDLVRWHAEPGVVPFMLVAGSGVDVVGYGEVWEDPDEGEAELARLVVDPARRGRGHGRDLARALADEARHRGFGEVWLRVVPDNAAAIRAYEAAGFRRTTPDREAGFNAGQPRPYAWFRDARHAPANGPDAGEG